MDFAPIVLDEYANTSSAGSIIAFHKHNQSLKENDLAIICSFGAGYSIGNVIVRKISLKIVNWFSKNSLNHWFKIL